MAEEIAKESEINIRVAMDEFHNPLEISWVATDSGVDKHRPVKAFMLSLWDEKENNSMRIDLWNKELMVEEMYTFVYQNILSMADTMQRATGDEELAQDMKDFAAYYAKRAGLVKG
jgi:gliding motility-associated protein GldC